MSNLTATQRALVGIGASLASHCIPCITYHVRKGRQAGLSDDVIEEAIGLAEAVGQVPARSVREAASAALAGDSTREPGTNRRTACGSRRSDTESSSTAAPSCCGEPEA